MNAAGNFAGGNDPRGPAGAWRPRQCPAGVLTAWIQGWGRMAGDFVMVQHATPRKPEVLRLASILGVPPAHAFGLCVMTWMWFDEQTEDGHAVGVTDVTLDAVIAHVGFAKALSEVGWLTIRDGALSLPKFDRLMGQSAKKRAKDVKRQQKHRHSSVTKTCDKSVTKEEKRREEKRRDKENPLPLLLQTPDFISAWSDWEQHRSELKKPIKPTMAAAQLKMLEGMGHDRAIACIRHTIAMGWQGLREEESKSAQPKTFWTPPKV